ncbi:solute carrier family 45 member 3-like [Scleropages formosus]|uniref:Solute carrier family 45 member 3-like n=1 Tax=Scleropages formosus TaxID=113540 RepID=A0A0P7UCD8_SCLFO|nr:solute carrier family 45 member 3-like [Scleropages formosus]
MLGRRSQLHLVLLNSLTCGLEICVAAGITYVPPLLLKAGVEERYMTMVLGIGPVLGLLFIPLIGSASDRCTSRYGRRRPFIWLLSLGVLLSLLIIPHADVLATHWGRGGHPLQVGVLILGVALLDFCGQVCFTPLEALLSDLYGSEEEEACSQAFAMFSFMVSLGGCVGYLLPALDWSSGPLSLYLGGQEECLFTLLILIFVPSVLITMKVSEEPSHGALLLAPERSSLEVVYSCFPSRRCWARLWRPSLPPCLLRTCWSLTPTVYRSYYQVPRVMRQLCAAQLCSWMAVMSFMLFYTDFVGEGLYEGVPSAAPGTVSRQRYEEGVRMGSLGLFLQCATSTIFSLGMSRLVHRFGSRCVYLGSVVSFTVCTLVICLSKSIVLVTTMSALTGFSYATLQMLPYALTCHYHKEQERHMPKKKTKNLHSNGVTIIQEPAHLDTEEVDEFQLQKLSTGYKYSYTQLNDYNGSTRGSPMPDDQVKRGVGLDFAILDSTFLLSQVFPTLFMGMIVQFTESVTTYIACSSLIGFVAIYMANHVVFDQKDFKG